MGEPNAQREVTISRPFWVGKYEVTQEQYEKIMGKNPSQFKGKDNPVEKVSWFDAVKFCEELTKKEGKRLPKGYVFRLPTEAEWEYACRAGTDMAYSFGDDVGKLGEYAWFKDNSGEKTQPVGKKKPNPWGLYDMHGNVWEWCLDWHGGYPKNDEKDPVGPGSGSARVNRGGSWNAGAGHCRSANRNVLTPGVTLSALGFRVCLAAGP
jgi:formylglycine-generating enzyme required for sulfatase activity